MSNPTQFESPPPSSGNRTLTIVLVIVGVMVVMCGGLCAGCLFVANSAVKAIQKGVDTALKQVEEERAAVLRDFAPATAKAIVAAEANSEVVERIGKPIEPVKMHEVARYRGMDANGQEFTWDIEGPKGKAVITATAIREGEGWRVTEISVTFEDGSTVEVPELRAK